MLDTPPSAKETDMRKEVISPEREELEFRAEYNELMSKRQRVAAVMVGLGVGAAVVGMVAALAAILAGL